MKINENKIPRAEYPRPQFVRDGWKTLNGVWEYETDRAVSGVARGLCDAKSMPEKITVPFCRESVLSGIGDIDFCQCVWYRKTLDIDAEKLGGRVILHIGACDWRTNVWVNGVACGEHIGGYVSFEFDITDALTVGENNLVIRAYDDLLSKRQPGGKQSMRYKSYACSYTRTTGIWQSVWLEFVPRSYIKSVKYYPNIAESKLTVAVKAVGGEDTVVRAEAYYEGRAVGAAAAIVSGGCCSLEMKLDELHLWEIGKGRLYDLNLTFGDDCVKSYFGMRTVAVKDGALVLNGKKVFQRLVLDQGFYPDGIYTAPTEAELFADITRSMALGFNGARLHQKIFEPEFLSECDRRGYIVWGEHGNWCLDLSDARAYLPFASEWAEAVERDFNHPAIIGWCPLNETQPDQCTDIVRALGALTRAIDPTRVYIDTSGWTHIEGVSDIYDLHCYEQDPEKFALYMEPITRGEKISYYGTHKAYGAGLPTFVSEFGGIRRASDTNGWGYGVAPKDDDDFIERLRGLTKAICDNPVMTGFCYTQLTDVEQEINGLYTYDRKPKFDEKTVREIFGQKAVMPE